MISKSHQEKLEKSRLTHVIEDFLSSRNSSEDGSGIFSESDLMILQEILKTEKTLDNGDYGTLSLATSDAVNETQFVPLASSTFNTSDQTLWTSRYTKEKAQVSFPETSSQRLAANSNTQQTGYSSKELQETPQAPPAIARPREHLKQSASISIPSEDDLSKLENAEGTQKPPLSLIKNDGKSNKYSNLSIRIQS